MKELHHALHGIWAAAVADVHLAFDPETEEEWRKDLTLLKHGLNAYTNMAAGARQMSTGQDRDDAQLIYDLLNASWEELITEPQREEIRRMAA